MVAAAMGADGDLVSQRIARGCLCFAVWIQDSLAGYGWLSTGPEWIGEIQLELKPREREGYIWNCVTLLEHRRRGVFRSLVWGISSAGRRLGLRRLWIGSVAIPAESALAPLGFRPALRFDSSSLAGLHLMRVSRGPDARLASDACAALAVRPGLVIRGSRWRRH
jgi:Acetyltransferase (GNAT) family